MSRKNRQHPLSHIPGGCDVKIIHVDGFTKVFDLVTYPERYINDALDACVIVANAGYATKQNTIAEVYINEILVWDINDPDSTELKLKPMTNVDAEKIKRSARKSVSEVKRYAKRSHNKGSQITRKNRRYKS